jgi:hypothetical protein
MIIQFKEVGSKKLLKELYLTGHMPTAKDQVKINGKQYLVTVTAFDADNDKWVVWLRKFQ